MRPGSQRGQRLAGEIRDITQSSADGSSNNTGAENGAGESSAWEITCCYRQQNTIQEAATKIKQNYLRAKVIWKTPTRQQCTWHKSSSITHFNLVLPIQLVIMQRILRRRRTALIHVFHESDVLLRGNKPYFVQVGVLGEERVELVFGDTLGQVL